STPAIFSPKTGISCCVIFTALRYNFIEENLIIFYQKVDNFDKIKRLNKALAKGNMNSEKIQS
ncbi:MAG: hypothetical protein ACRCSC_07690, partial [Lactococcus garvieae]